MSKKTKKNAEDFEKVVLDIPEDEIWDYKIEGLAAPHINKPFAHATAKKIAFIVFMVFAIIISMYFSVKVLLNTGALVYDETGNGKYQLTQFSNNGSITEFDIDYVSEIIYKDNTVQLDNGGEMSDPNNKNFTIKKDESKPVTSIHEYAFNGDGTLQVINIGASVTEIDERAFYSCWALQCIYVDDSNPNYCDIDGVLYNKDMTEIICYPIDHDRYLRLQNGYAHLDENGIQVPDLFEDNGQPMEELWWMTEKYDAEFFKEYNLKTRTYVLPSTVKKIAPNCFNYANVTDIYMPDGLEVIETLAFYDEGNLHNIYTYTPSAEPMLDTSYNAVATLQGVYYSLPESLKFIGSDCFTKDRGLNYMYIPQSVAEIGHHAFWDSCVKEDGNLVGIQTMNISVSEDVFKTKTIGSEWLPKYDHGLFHKQIDVSYGATRIDAQETSVDWWYK